MVVVDVAVGAFVDCMSSSFVTKESQNLKIGLWSANV